LDHATLGFIAWNYEENQLVCKRL